MGQWPSKNFIDTNSSVTSIMGNRFSVGNFKDENAFGFLNQIKISGQKTVQTKADLQYIPVNLLSSAFDNYNSYPDGQKPAKPDGSDALGQLWWVQDEKCFYQLVKWGANAPTDNIWAKSNISTSDQSSNTEYNALVKRLETLEAKIANDVILKSPLTGNNAKYIWSGTLEQFNKLTNKPSNTTFIISN